MIIELQGTLETKEDVSLEGKAIGDLHFDAKVGAYSDRSFRLRVVSLMHQSIPATPPPPTPATAGY